MKKSSSNRMIYWLSWLGFFAIFSTTISKNPVLPLFAKAMGSSDALLGFISAISPLAGIIFSFPIGFLIDRLGRKKLLFISAFLFLISPLFYIFIESPAWLIPVRFLHGMATAILTPLTAVMIFHAYPKNKGEKLGYYSSATLFGRMLAPMVGGATITAFAYLGGLLDYKMVYILAFVFALPVALIALAIDHRIEVKNDIHNLFRLKDISSAFEKILQQGKLFSTSLCEMSIYFSFGVIETFLPVYLSGLGYSASRIGLIFSLQVLAIALTKPFFGRLADKIDKRKQILIGLAVLGLSIAAIPFIKSYIFISILGIIFGLGMSFATIATNSYVGEVAKEKEMGASMGALSSIMDIGHSSGPFITGFIITYISMSFGFFFSLIVCAGAATFFIFENYKSKTW